MLGAYEPADVGWLSLLPPLVTMILALATKEVIISLLMGILLAATIYVVKTHRGIVDIVQVLFDILGSRVSSNMYMCLFMFLMGSLVQLMSKAGGTRAFGEWSAKIVKGRKSAIFFTFLIASTLFLDDYFSIITVSAVMRVVLDRNQVSKPKSAYVIHTMAGSMCILIPISSWAAVVITQIGDCGIKKPFNVFLGAISYNIYPVLCFLLILFTTFSGIDVGGMTTYEENAIKGESANDGSVMVIREETKESEMGDGKVLDLVLPILVLIFFSVLFMVYLGGGFSGKKPIQQIFADSDTGQAITYASFVTLLFSLVLYVPRKLMTFLEFMEETKQGMKSMIDTFLILVLAWTIGGVSGSLLKTGEYVGDFIVKCSLPLAIVPTVIFLVGALLTFALGTTWAGFSVLIPIVCNICKQTDIRLLVPCISACLCGSVYGDNISPICDNTVLVSSCIRCQYIIHVKTEAVYATTVAILSLVGYIIMGITGGNHLLSMGIPIVLELVLFGILWIIRKTNCIVRHAMSSRKQATEAPLLESQPNTVVVV